MLVATVACYASLSTRLKADKKTSKIGGLFIASCLRDGLKVLYRICLANQWALILDDALARRQVFRMDLTIVGTAALLFTAQKKGLIADAELLINDLNQTGYRISDTVVTLLKRKNSLHKDKVL